MKENKKQVIARMTVCHENGRRTIVEVQEDATFSAFYRIYGQEGRRRSTKQQLRSANRNEGVSNLFANAQQPGLEAIAKHFQIWSKVESIKIRVIKKRLYRKLLTAPPDQLGMVKEPESGKRFAVLMLRRFSPARVAGVA